MFFLRSYFLLSAHTPRPTFPTPIPPTLLRTLRGNRYYQGYDILYKRKFENNITFCNLHLSTTQNQESIKNQILKKD